MNARLEETLKGETETPPLGWEAELRIELALRAGKTCPIYVNHRGPLRIQRPFYPENDGTCHLILLHPPGGVVGGDGLEVKLSLGEDARALVTTPAATKLYRSAGATSQIRQTVRGAQGSLVQWLPQETIAFSGAKAQLKTEIHLQTSANFIGWEVLCLGRPAVGELFDRGALTLQFELYRDDAPLYLDRVLIGTGVDAREEPWGLRGQAVLGTLLFSGRNGGLSKVLREPGGPGLAQNFSTTDLEGVTVLRYLGPSVRECWKGFVHAWSCAREEFGYAKVSEPRIWSC